MILVDTSVWIDHLRSGEAVLADLLDRGLVRAHPFVIGELALGSLGQRDPLVERLEPPGQRGHVAEQIMFGPLDKVRSWSSCACPREYAAGKTSRAGNE